MVCQIREDRIPWHWWIAFLFAVNPGTAAIATTCMTCGGNGGFVANQRFSKGDYLAVKSIS